MNTKQKTNQKGFTIIEVMIVLAIAGLIMVVIFVAVPSLQRSGRNNALNSDMNNTLAAVGEYASNNGGSLPRGINPAFVSGSKTAVLANASTGTPTGNPVTVKLNGSVTSLTVVTAGSLNTSSPVGNAQIVTGAAGKCNPDNTGLTGGGTTRSYAILYVAESGTATNVLKCVGS